MKLISFPGDAQFPTHSPFCLKAMCLLEMAKVDWQPEMVQDFEALPLGKVPVARVGDALIPDSHNIQAYLESNGADFMPGLSRVKKAASHALIRTVEESLRLGLVHDRWLNDECWAVMKEIFFAAVPEPMREQAAEEARGHVRTGLMSEGIARFSPEDRQARFDNDLEVIDATLNGQQFLFGDTPTAADAAVAPVLDMILTLPVATDLRKATEARTALAPYVARVREAIYPDASKVMQDFMSVAAE